MPNAPKGGVESGQAGHKGTVCQRSIWVVDSDRPVCEGHKDSVVVVNGNAARPARGRKQYGGSTSTTYQDLGRIIGKNQPPRTLELHVISVIKAGEATHIQLASRRLGIYKQLIEYLESLGDAAAAY